MTQRSQDSYEMPFSRPKIRVVSDVRLLRRSGSLSYEHVYLTVPLPYLSAGFLSVCLFSTHRPMYITSWEVILLKRF